MRTGQVELRREKLAQRGQLRQQFVSDPAGRGEGFLLRNASADKAVSQSHTNRNLPTGRVRSTNVKKGSFRDIYGVVDSCQVQGKN